MNKFAKYINENPKIVLPGFEAQIKMAPKLEGVNFRKFKAKEDSKKSAVLLLIIGVQDNFEILFTLRSEKLRNHNGQISFPGGRTDNNETAIETALRETNEEVGLNSYDINIIGELTELYVPPSNSIIKPIIGYIESLGKININESEVQEAFTINIEEFYKPEKYRVSQRMINGQIIDIPEWNIHHTTPLWGATAIIMSEFLELHRKFNNTSY